MAGWEPDGNGTLERLRALAGRGWRPQDCDLIDDYCDRLERWVLTGADLLDRRPVVSLHVPCPRCGARFAYRDDAGESVRVAGVAGVGERVSLSGVSGVLGAVGVSLAGSVVGL